MQPVAAGGLGTSFEANRVQFLAHQLRGLNDSVERTLLWVEIDQDKIRMVQFRKAAHPWIVVNARQINQIQQTCPILGENVTNLAASLFGLNQLGAQPGRKTLRHI